MSQEVYPDSINSARNAVPIAHAIYRADFTIIDRMKSWRGIHIAKKIRAGNCERGRSMSNTLKYLRLYSDDAGISHFAPIEIALAPREFAPPAAPFSVSALEPASRHGFLQLPAGWIGELHPSPIRMWIAVLSGEMEFEAGDGAKHCIVPGDCLLLEDTTGMGHGSRVLGADAAVLSVVHV
jgi:hypothetical protein